MNDIFNITIDEQKVKKIFLEELRKCLERIEHKKVLWDMKELCRQTSMSENTIKEKFFYDERFPKYKLGGKWYFPALEAEVFLLMWIKEQKIE